MDNVEKFKPFIKLLVGSGIQDFIVAVMDFYCIAMIEKSKDLLVLGAHDDGYPRYAMLSFYISASTIATTVGKIGLAFLYMVKIRKFDILPLVAMNTLMIFFHDVGVGLFYRDYISVIGNGPSMHTSHLCILPRSTEVVFNALKLGYILHILRHKSNYDAVNQNPEGVQDIDTIQEVDTMQVDTKQRKRAQCVPKPKHWLLFGISILGYIGTIVILAFIAPTPKNLRYKEDYPPNFNKVEVYMTKPGILEDQIDVARTGQYDTFMYQVPANSIMKVAKLQDIVYSKTRAKITMKSYDDDDDTIYKTYTTKCLNSHYSYHNTTKQLEENWCSKCKSDLEFMFRFFDPKHDVQPHGRLDYNMRTYINGSSNSKYLNLRWLGYDLYLFLPDKENGSPEGDTLLHNPWSGRFLKRLNYKMFKKCGTSSAAFHKGWIVYIVTVHITLNMITFLN